MAHRTESHSPYGVARAHPPYGGVLAEPGYKDSTNEVSDFPIERSKTKKERFLRLPCAYGGEANSPCLGITLILLVEREGLEPSTPAL
jgi:hypothetical protein